jgi:hypothetical protein
MTDPDLYLGPCDPNEVTDDDVHEALAFLVAIEPDPDGIDSLEAYDAAMENYRDEIATATRALRRFAEQAQPQRLEEMQATYYGFSNDQRYLETAEMSAVVTGALGEAWNGVGPWRR